ncbi:hypothetical protein GE21DRAFT_1361 [Neurospora crassa]|uniref:GPI anchored protein n=1 Tax=Neurospora crassa (strain ATCC 24698 / 74-OR23-1A / CBS 708.71 / DSM 1257 / FGSC 987) TaxID=367110 RepID=Q7SDW3_NEUCR|nr:hypothetical protein NCU03293 [Neurospora crassa OR74A]EAA34983.1 hypothetical protein NCU03293 [Neurospora crassa OR74A]KHE81074.1 hypothetical protein GE21DRAFT_1361 [Neurospora crassa]|eukprot:XP_964219.1 hypothetical protein NCU03293 [Neurospora crassa OR74A]
MQFKSILTVLATGLSLVAAQADAADSTMTSTATMTLTVTITSCNPTVSNCPGNAPATSTSTSTSTMETSSVVLTTSSVAPVETTSSSSIVVIPSTSSSSTLSWSFPQVNSTTLAGPTASQPLTSAFITQTQSAVVTASQPAGPSSPVTAGAAGLAAQSVLLMSVIALGAALLA